MNENLQLFPKRKMIGLREYMKNIFIFLFLLATGIGVPDSYPPPTPKGPNGPAQPRLTNQE